MITANDIISLDPCWLHAYTNGAERIRALVGTGVTALQIARDDRVSLDDRRWVLCHLLARGPRPDLRGLVRWEMHQALKVGHLVTDSRYPGATEVVLRWTTGDASDEELGAARGVLRSIWCSTYAARPDRAHAAYAAYVAAALPVAPFFAAGITATEEALEELAQIIDAL